MYHGTFLHCRLSWTILNEIGHCGGRGGGSRKGGGGGGGHEIGNETGHTTDSKSFLMSKVTIQTHKRFKRTMFITTKHNKINFGVSPLFKLQNNT